MKCHSKMWVFYHTTQCHRCRKWHADDRNVHQSCCLRTECSFHSNKLCPLSRIWQYIQPATESQAMCNQVSQGLPHSADELRSGTWTQCWWTGSPSLVSDTLEKYFLNGWSLVFTVPDRWKISCTVSVLLCSLVMSTLWTKYQVRADISALEAENIPVLEWPAHSPNTSASWHVWVVLDRRVQERVPLPATILSLQYPATSHRY